MTTSPIFAFPTPNGSVANDFSASMAALAADIDGKIAGYSSGTYAARGTAASRNRRFYKVTDNTIEGGLFFSDGTNWIRLTPSPWIAWTPTKAVTDGGGAVSSTVFATYSTTGLTGFVYRVLPGNAIEVDVEYLVSLYGAYDYCGLWITTPVTAAKATLMTGEMQSDIARCQTYDSAIGNAIQLLPHSGFAAKLWQFNSSIYIGRWAVSGSVIARVHGTYPV